MLDNSTDNPVKNWYVENTKFLDRWTIVWMILAVILIMALVNQLYLSIGNEKFKQRQAYEYTQFGFLITVPVLVSFLVWHQASLGDAVGQASLGQGTISTGSTSSGIMKSLPSLLLVIVLSIAAISLQTYVIYGNEKFHRRRLLELGLLVIVFLLVGASMMAVQPVF